jgi:SSS family solute:Na+ symporter
LFVGMTGFIVGPLRRMEVLTIPEFYERRFNKRVRVIGGVLLVLAGVLNMGLF